MPIVPVQQASSQDNRPWFTGVTLQVAGMTLTIGGAAYVAGQAHALNASVPITAPAAGTDHHALYICEDGTLILDPGPSPASPLYGQILWFDVPAGTTDLGTVTINQLIHIPEV